MHSSLIIIRGNSASGKTALAEACRERLGATQTLVLSQDVIRRQILHTHDHTGTPAIGLIAALVEFGRQHYRYVILEGILRRDVYGRLLKTLMKNGWTASYVYYLDIPFTETCERDRQKTQPFGERALKSWWRPDDELTQSDQRLTDGTITQWTAQVVATVRTQEQKQPDDETNS